MQDYAATLNDQQGFGVAGEQNPSSLTKEQGMAQISEKFQQLGEQVYVDAGKVKESNNALQFTASWPGLFRPSTSCLMVPR